MSDATPEQLSRPEIESRQLGRLRALLDDVIGQNPYWSEQFEQAGLGAASIQSLNDLQQLPLSTKAQLVEDQIAHPPYGTNLTYPLGDFSRLHQTSGTTGTPMRWLDTPDSWSWFMECWSQIYRIVGLQSDDVLAFPFSFGPFIGFWAAFEGATRLGNLCLSLGGMSSEARLKMMLENEATVVCCTPTYALRLAEVAQEQHLDLAGSPIRAIIVAGEPGGNIPATRQRIEQAWGARVFDHWGMTDIGSLGIEPESAPGGLLILETECIAEIVDPETGDPIEAGKLGELVITNLGRTGMPLIRYRTGDLVEAATSPCPSGLKLLRLEGGIRGRSDDMLTIRGNNVFPSSIEAILREFEAVVEFRIVVQSKRSMHHLKIEVEPTAEIYVDDAVLGLTGAISREIKDRLNFQAEVVAVPTGSLPRFELKGRRLVRED